MTSASNTPHYKGSTRQDVDQYVVKEDQEGKVVRIKALALDIIWGKDNRYWHINETDKSAELVQVSWLEVNGSLDMTKLKAGTKYKLEFMVKLKADAFGWNSSPVYIMAKPGKNSNYIWKKTDLSTINEDKKITSFPIPSGSSLEFTVPTDNNDKLTFGLFEIWARKWKGGLVIEEVVISKVE